MTLLTPNSDMAFALLFLEDSAEKPDAPDIVPLHLPKDTNRWRAGHSGNSASNRVEFNFWEISGTQHDQNRSCGAAARIGASSSVCLGVYLVSVSIGHQAGLAGLDRTNRTALGCSVDGLSEALR
jgi:hypothetical protein